MTIMLCVEALRIMFISDKFNNMPVETNKVTLPLARHLEENKIMNVSRSANFVSYLIRLCLYS